MQNLHQKLNIKKKYYWQVVLRLHVVFYPLRRIYIVFCISFLCMFYFMSGFITVCCHQSQPPHHHLHQGEKLLFFLFFLESCLLLRIILISLHCHANWRSKSVEKWIQINFAELFFIHLLSYPIYHLRVMSCSLHFI